MTNAELRSICDRDLDSGETWFTGPASFTAQAARDRRELLSLVEELLQQIDRLERESGCVQPMPVLN